MTCRYPLSSAFVPAATQIITQWSAGILSPVGFLDQPDCVCNASMLSKWLTEIQSSKTSMEPLIGTTGIYDLRVEKKRA